MVIERVSVSLLADRREAVRTVCEWVVHEWGADKSPAAIDAFADSLRAQLNRDRVPLQVVAMLGERVVGVAMLKEHELRTLYPELKNWVGSVLVAPEFRGRQIASLLVRNLEQQALGLSIQVLHLQTEDLSGGLYAKLGWQSRDVVEHDGLRRLIMMKELAAGER